MYRARKASLPDLVAFRIDFAAWLRSHPSRDRRINLMLATGESTRAVAKRFDISEGRISQLRRRYERG
jgi:DNA-binding NarL/FixJ family response regulator